MVSAVETDGLTKRYGELLAVDRLDLKIEGGEIFGLLGPNGAGKTTILSMLATLLKPTSGTARVNGHDIIEQPHEVRRQSESYFKTPVAMMF